jgi:hypothetical protein
MPESAPYWEDVRLILVPAKGDLPGITISKEESADPGQTLLRNYSLGRHKSLITAY